MPAGDRPEDRERGLGGRSATRVLLTGASGQLGRQLAPQLGARARLTCTARSRSERSCDLSDPDAAARLLDAVRPEIVVNCAAWTRVDDAEDDPQSAFALNRDLPAVLGQWCASHDALLIHYSTDYVFSGVGTRAWREEDPVGPVSVYGQSKLAGERTIAASGCRAVILRTAWLYSAEPGNFLRAILDRAREGERLRVVNDQIGSPTWAGSLARVTMRLLDRAGQLPAGCLVFHAACQGRPMSWYEFARLALDEAGRRGIVSGRARVVPIESRDWPQKARRPAWSVLDAGRLEAFCGQNMDTVEDGLHACLDEMKKPTC